MLPVSIPPSKGLDGKLESFRQEVLYRFERFQQEVNGRFDRVEQRLGVIEGDLAEIKQILKDKLP